jgi:hypothetical protein
MMPLAFLAPLALAAAAWIAVPWWLHHIRRPERQTELFSSLMFVPDIRKEVIERRRLQHLLLLLLRMAVLLLLAFAFARPFVSLPVSAGGPELQKRHAILIDSSYSMIADEAFTKAKQEAHKILDALDPVDQAAIIEFGTTATVLSPLASKDTARIGIDKAKLTNEATDYETALRTAAELLLDGYDSAKSAPPAIHVISDFQLAGMPARTTAWRVPAPITFNPVDIGHPDGNLAVSEAFAAEDKDKKIIIRAKIKNWFPTNSTPVDVKLSIDNALPQTKTVEVAPGNATQVAFEMERPETGVLHGFLEIDDPGITPDNRRYVAWNARPKQKVVIVKGPDRGARWPAEAILQVAMSESLDTPWLPVLATSLTPESFVETGIVAVVDVASLSDDSIVALNEYLNKGGKALIMLGDRDPKESVLAALGIRALNTQRESPNPDRFVSLSWIDFKHPIFHAFSGARYNDFSDVRFFSRHHIEIVPNAEHTATPVARFEPTGAGEGSPAVVEVKVGEGRAVIWALSLDFEWTNFAKTAQFVPLLHETLSHLSGGPENPRAWLIGDIPTPPRPEFAPFFTASTATEKTPLDQTTLAQPGLLYWRSSVSEKPERIEPVNVVAAEGNPASITPAEFALRMFSTPNLADGITVNATQPHSSSDNSANNLEYGRYFLGLVLAALLTEIWYAGRLT